MDHGANEYLWRGSKVVKCARLKILSDETKVNENRASHYEESSPLVGSRVQIPSPPPFFKRKEAELTARRHKVCELGQNRIGGHSLCSDFRTID